MYTHGQNVYMHQNIYIGQKQKTFNFGGILLAHFLHTSEYIRMGISIKDLSEDEILEVVKDGWNYFILNKS